MVMEIRLADARLAVDPVHDGQTLAADGLDCGEPVIGLKVPTRIVVDAFGPISARPCRLLKLIAGLFDARLLQHIEWARRHPARSFGYF